MNSFHQHAIEKPDPRLVDEVRRTANQRSTSILENFHLLNEIVKRHGTKIQKRWEKKTRTKRLKILLDKWPDMPKFHRPDFAIYRRDFGTTRSVSAQELGAFKWPYINQEDLANTRSLPLLLNARGRNHPSNFAAANSDAMHIGKVKNVTAPPCFYQYTVILNGTTHEEEYGKILPWTEHEKAKEWMFTRQQFCPCQGLDILEAQDRLMQFLVQCSQLILHDISAEDLISDTYPVEDQPPRKDAINISDAASLAIMIEEAPYRSPADLDLARMEALLDARAAQAEDHIWSLREDPHYFAGHIYEVKEHLPELSTNADGSVSTPRPSSNNRQWAHIVGFVLERAYYQLEMFSLLRDQATKVRKLKEKNADKIIPGEALPEEYLESLLVFRWYLTAGTKAPRDDLKKAVALSLPYRDTFVEELRSTGDESQNQSREKFGMDLESSTGYLAFLLRVIWDPDDAVPKIRIPLILDELDRLINNDPKARERIFPLADSLIGEISLIGECLRQVDTYFPWADGFREKMRPPGGEKIHNDCNKTLTARFRAVQLMCQDGSLMRVASFANPSDKKFDCPLGRKRSKENIEKLRAAEANLDIFWAKVDGLTNAKIGDVEDMALKRLLKGPSKVSRTPEWREPTTSTETLSPAEPSPENSESVEPLSQLFPDLGVSSYRKEALSMVSKDKVKTRGKAASLTRELTDQQETPDEQPTASQARFQVDARALKVFRTLFFNPETRSTAGQVAWPDFLHAMASTGFAAQKQHGSVWQFESSEIGVRRFINFHEPHPVNKLDFHIARYFGRRLNRTYGWSGDSFVLKGKGGE